MRIFHFLLSNLLTVLCRWFLSCSGNGFTVLKRSLIQKYSLYINIGLVIRLVSDPLKTRINAGKRPAVWPAVFWEPKELYLLNT